MKNILLVAAIATISLGATNTYAQNKSTSGDAEEASYSMRYPAPAHHFDEFHYWRAWKKNAKRQMKEDQYKQCVAAGRPYDADRKRRKAIKKAWKADVLEDGFRNGYYRNFWY
jgi:hypothetical protein